MQKNAGQNQKKFSCFLPGTPAAILSKRTGSVLGGVGIEILLDHQRHLEDDGVVELPQIQTGEFLDLLEPVDQGVAVYKETAAGLGDVEVVLEEPLDGEEGLGIQ